MAKQKSLTEKFEKGFRGWAHKRPAKPKVVGKAKKGKAKLEAYDLKPHKKKKQKSILRHGSAFFK